ncbi:MAG: TlpA family protein disulfide reductase [Actinobacteria bacterium]|nr:TlpA family protein disulfide reductase [Actinomycetota bacterium]
MDTNGSSAITPTPDAGMPRRRVLGAVLLVGAVLVIGAVLFTGGNDDTGDLAQSGELSEFHQIQVESLDGSTLDFAQYNGTPVILNFFASWCGPCRAEMPVLDALHHEWDGDVVVVGLNSVEGAEAAQSLIDDTGVTFPAALDVDAVLLERYEAIGMPTTVFIDGNGNVLDTWVGELTEADLRDRVDRFFGVS